MSEKTYVIRSYSFGYNDETFYVSGSSVHSGYHDEAEARRAYAALERASINNFSLHERESFFGADADFIDRADAFIFAKTGEHIAEDGELCSESIPADKLSDDDLIEFVKLANLQAYKLVAFDGEPTFYALWICKDESYLMDYDEDFESIVTHESKETFLKMLDELAYNHDWSMLNGSLEELSDNPLLLQQLIDSDSNLSYDAEHKQLKVIHENASTYAALNALLKQPLFEIRSFSLTEVLQLQKEFGGYNE